jgi:hypothetical protein
MDYFYNIKIITQKINKTSKYELSNIDFLFILRKLSNQLSLFFHKTSEYGDSTALPSILSEILVECECTRVRNKVPQTVKIKYLISRCGKNFRRINIDSGALNTN